MYQTAVIPIPFTTITSTIILPWNSNCKIQARLLPSRLFLTSPIASTRISRDREVRARSYVYHTRYQLDLVYSMFFAFFVRTEAFWYAFALTSLDIGGFFCIGPSPGVGTRIDHLLGRMGISPPDVFHRHVYAVIHWTQILPIFSVVIERGTYPAKIQPRPSNRKSAMSTWVWTSLIVHAKIPSKPYCTIRLTVHIFYWPPRWSLY